MLDPGLLGTITVIAAWGLDGVRVPLAFPGATNTAVFQTDVEQALAPARDAGDVVVFDHLKPHLAVGVAKSIEEAGDPRAASATVQPRLHPDRGDVLEGQAGSPSGPGEGKGRAL